MLTPIQADEVLRSMCHAAKGREPGDRRAWRGWLRERTPRELLRLDERARFMSWYRVQPLGESKVWTTIDLAEPDGLAAAVASLHPDGYLRERAVRGLAAVPVSLATRFLALRATDHVEQVRRRALAALVARTNQGDVLAAMPILHATASRTHGAGAAETYMRAVEQASGRGYVRWLLESEDRTTRRAAYVACLTRDLLTIDELGELIRTEPDQYARKVLAEHFIRTAPPALAKRLLLDSPSYTEGRLLALQHLKDEDFDETDLTRRLLDRSPRVREAAQWRYRRANRSPADFYRERWTRADATDPTVTDPKLDVILAGLRDTRQTLPRHIAEDYLDSDNPRIRLAGLKLWPNGTPGKNTLLRMICDTSPRVAKAAARLLGRDPTVRYNDLSRAARSESPAHRRGAWLVRKELGTWDRVRSDLEHMQDPDPDLSQLAHADLLTWLQRRAATTYTKAYPSQKEAIQALLRSTDLDRSLAEQIAFHTGVNASNVTSSAQPRGERSVGGSPLQTILRAWKRRPRRNCH